MSRLSKPRKTQLIDRTWLVNHVRHLPSKGVRI